MEPSMIQIILIAIWTGLAGVDLFDGLLHIHRPLFSGMVIGFILGDVTTGLITGATLELILLGAMPVGGAQPPNVVIGGVAGVVLAITSGLDSQAAVGIAIPFAVFMQSLITLYFTIFVPVMHKVDNEVEIGNGLTAIPHANYFGMAVLFIMYASVATLLTIGGTKSADLITRLPEWITHGLSVGGGMLTAVGLAILLKIMLARRYAIYLALGFILVTFFNAPILPIAGIAIIIALIEFYLAQEIGGTQVVSNTKQGEDDGI
ncbi:MAG: PTS sugar transporter subunit IIC [Brevinema sp.]